MTMPTTETCFECDGTGKVLAGSRAAMEQRRDELKARAERLTAALRNSQTVLHEWSDEHDSPADYCNGCGVTATYVLKPEDHEPGCIMLRTDAQMDTNRAALADAPEPKACPKCERLTAQIHRSVGALNEALSGVMSGILKISDDAHDQIGEPIADLVDALVDVPNAGQEQTSEEKQAEAHRALQQRIIDFVARALTYEYVGPGAEPDLDRVLQRLAFLNGMTDELEELKLDAIFFPSARGESG